MAQTKGASAEPTGLGAPEGAEPHSRLVATPAIPSAERLHPLLGVGEVPCRSCKHDFPWPATHIASPKKTTGEAVTDWPVCREHVEWAMVAGWFPIREVTEADFASAIETATAGETVKHGSTEGESAVGATSAETPTLRSPRRG